MSELLKLNYDTAIENSLLEIARHLKSDYVLSKRAVALLLLQEDEDMLGKVQAAEGSSFLKIIDIINRVKQHYEQPLNYVIALTRQQKVQEITGRRVYQQEQKSRNLAEIMSRLTMRPLTGLPILLLVLYFGLYQFVGVFGAGTLVDLLEENIFAGQIIPWVNHWVSVYVPWFWLQELLARDYGIITLGLRYSIAIILPIVGTFFFMFAILEDSGYLPRLAMLVDAVFKKIGLSGRAVIPMTLGFGCGTMATMVSRTLETKRERVIATFLLSLAIPCSAQLGVILALLSGNPTALLIWAGFMAFIFLFIGFLTAKLMPGAGPSFYMELPPLRWPKLSNVLVKTYSRIQWYFLEILPLFIFASVLIWLGNLTGLFGWLINQLGPVMQLIGLPGEAAQSFLFGFFRRDYGAAGLYDLQQSGLLTATQLVVAAAVMTLFMPCIAQLAMTIKERGLRAALAMAAFIFPFALFNGFLLNWLLGLGRVL